MPPPQAPAPAWPAGPWARFRDADGDLLLFFRGSLALKKRRRGGPTVVFDHWGGAWHPAARDRGRGVPP